MSKSGTIIIVDDNKGVLTAVQILLKNYFSKVVTLSSPVTLTTAIREETPEVVLLDMNFTSGINTGNEGLFWLHEIKKVRRELPVVLFTAYADIDLAIRGIKGTGQHSGTLLGRKQVYATTPNTDRKGSLHRRQYPDYR